jgi:tetratricopeptide (TPR) repeat protein
MQRITTHLVAWRHESLRHVRALLADGWRSLAERVLGPARRLLEALGLRRDEATRAGALVVRGRLDEALGLLDRALESASGCARARLYNQRGAALWMKRDVEGAYRAYAEATRLDASEPTSWANLAEAAWALGQVIESEAAARRAAELSSPAARRPALPPPRS